MVTMYYGTELSLGGSKPVTIVGMLPRITNVQTDPPFQISRFNFLGCFWKCIDIEQYASWLWKFRLVHFSVHHIIHEIGMHKMSLDSPYYLGMCLHNFDLFPKMKEML